MSGGGGSSPASALTPLQSSQSLSPPMENGSLPESTTGRSTYTPDIALSGDTDWTSHKRHKRRSILLCLLWSLRDHGARLSARSGLYLINEVDTQFHPLTKSPDKS